jgi:hypothetical protein
LFIICMFIMFIGFPPLPPIGGVQRLLDNRKETHILLVHVLALGCHEGLQEIDVGSPNRWAVLENLPRRRRESSQGLGQPTMLSFEPRESFPQLRSLRLQAPEYLILRRVVAQVRIIETILHNALGDFPVRPFSTSHHCNLPFQQGKKTQEIGMVLAQAPQHLGHGALRSSLLPTSYCGSIMRELTWLNPIQAPALQLCPACPRVGLGFTPKRSSVRSIMVFAAPISAWRTAREASTSMMMPHFTSIR